MYLDHFIDVAFGTSKFGRVLHFDQHDKIKIVPQVVFHSEMFLERNCFVVKGPALQTESTELRQTGKNRKKSVLFCYQIFYRQLLRLCFEFSLQLRWTVAINDGYIVQKIIKNLNDDCLNLKIGLSPGIFQNPEFLFPPRVRDVRVQCWTIIRIRSIMRIRSEVGTLTA